MKSVLMSIRPKWCKLIASGKKTIEVRKTKPKLRPPFKVYIYCTLPPKEELFTHGCFREYANELIRLQSGEIVYDYGMRLCVDPEDRPYSQDNFLCRKVIGEFVCDGIYAVIAHPTIFAGHPLLFRKAIDDACITDDEVERYSAGKDVFGWHISDLVIYDKPKELSEFFHACNKPRDTDCSVCVDRRENRCKSITKPPQSWCYVEGSSDG